MSWLDLNSVFVIESLDAEYKTGKDLYQDSIKIFEYKLHGFETKYSHVSNKKELFEILEEIIYLSQKKDYKPILHIEGHGNEKGLQLNPSGEFVLWEELGDYLRKINIAIKNSLIITTGVCFGSGLHKSINTEEPAPFFGFIAPKTEIKNIEIIETYNEFYQTLLFEKDFIKAIKSIKYNPNLALFGSESIFEENERNLKNVMKQDFRDKAKMRLDMVIKTKKLKLNQAEYDEFLEKLLKNKKSEIIKEFQNNKKRFLMTDRFPEISDRFLK